MKVSDLEFIRTEHCESDVLYAVNLEDGSMITVLDRETGYCYGIRDIETGYRDSNKKFCLASCGFDIREYFDLSVNDAIELIKKESNTVRWDE
jgi:hypothetical protein